MTRSGNRKIRRAHASVDQGELAALVQEIRARVLNCSASGCLLETDRPVPVGTVAALSFSIGGGTFSEIVRVVRCRATGRTAGRHHVAAEFLAVTPPYKGSLRHAMRLGATELAGLIADDGAVGATKFLTDADNQNDGQGAGIAENAESQGF